MEQFSVFGTEKVTKEKVIQIIIMNPSTDEPCERFNIVASGVVCKLPTIKRENKFWENLA